MDKIRAGIELTPEHPVSTLGEYASTAERAGFDAVFASHHYNNRDEFVTLTEIARTTDEVRLGPGITNPYETHPVTLASRMATLDELADGRGIYGLGAGDRSTLSNLSYEAEQPLRRVLEAMQVARSLFAGERVDHDGTFGAEDAGLNYASRQIPIYVGAQGPDMTRMAAKYADGVLFNGAHPRDVAWARERVEEGLAGRGNETGEAFDFAVYASVSVAEDPEQARESGRPPVAFITGGAPPPVLDRHDIDRERATRIGERISAGQFTEAFELVTERMLSAFCIAGTPSTVCERVEQILETADSIVFGSPLGPDPGAAISLAGESLPRSLG